MRRIFIVLLVLIVALSVVGTAVAAPNADHNRNFKAHLTGDQEVPPNESKAQGQALFKVKDASSIDFKLIVANIEDVLAAHIHCAPAGENGPVGVTLFGGPLQEGRVQGILAQGTITEPDPGNACGWESVAAVVAAMESGNAYVNVHTLAFPAGEIRGQIH